MSADVVVRSAIHGWQVSVSALAGVAAYARSAVPRSVARRAMRFKGMTPA